MPTYEYACAKCGERFDVYQSFSDEPLKKHEACGGKLTKVFGPVGIVLKGSGFYKTDNRSSKAKAAKSSDGGSSESGSGGSDSGSDSSDSGSGSSSDTKSTTDKAQPAKKSDAKPATKTKSA